MFPSPYSEEKIQSLCAYLDVHEKSKTNVVRLGLQTSAHIWRTNSELPPITVQPTEADLELDRIIDILHDAKSVISELTGEQWSSLQLGATIYNQMLPRSALSVAVGAIHFENAPRKLTVNDPTRDLSCELSDLVQYLDAISDAAFYARTPRLQTKDGRKKSGRPPDFLLSEWIEQMRFLCSSSLCIPFTCGQHGDEPTSKAARFCVEAYKVLSPQETSQRILTEMKKEISRLRLRPTD